MYDLASSVAEVEVQKFKVDISNSKIAMDWTAL